VWFLLLIAACGGPGEGERAEDAIGLEAFSPGMWEQRALTIRAGLEEAVAMAESGDKEKHDIREFIHAVYTGSFEPELEKAIRLHLGARVALELELAFGHLMKSITNRRIREDSAQSLAEKIAQAAGILESKAASLRSE
jgi:hypothetical protein